MDPQYANAMLTSAGRRSSFQQVYCSSTKSWITSGNQIPFLEQRQAVRSGIGITVLNFLHQARNSHLEELVQVAGSNGEEFQTLQEGIGFVLGLLQYAAIECQPGSSRLM